MEQDDRKQGTENLDEEMERDTEIRRETQTRGSLGIPPSGEKADRPESTDESIPEFNRLDDEDRTDKR